MISKVSSSKPFSLRELFSLRQHSHSVAGYLTMLLNFIRKIISVIPVIIKLTQISLMK